MTAPGVSVLMSVRDGEQYVAAAIESALGQSVPPGEVIVVDDGSADGTADVLRSFGSSITVVNQRRRGVAAGHNRALRHAQFGVIGFLDADDLWAPDAIELRLERLFGSDEPDSAGGATRQFVSPELDASAAARFAFNPAPARAALLGALLFRRDRMRRFGPFDESLRVGAPVDWMARARTLGITTGWIDAVVLHRRIHGANLSLTASGTYAAMLDVVRRQHQRRRGGAR